MIYFIRSGQYVKIGVSARPWDRLAEFQTGNPEPLEMLAVGPGDFAFESELHRLFGEHRGVGEWFQDSERIRAVAGFMRDTFPELQVRPRVEAIEISTIQKRAADYPPVCYGNGRLERNSDGYWRRRIQLKNPDGSPMTYITKSGKLGYKRGSEYARITPTTPAPAAGEEAAP